MGGLPNFGSQRQLCRLAKAFSWVSYGKEEEQGEEDLARSDKLKGFIREYFTVRGQAMVYTRLLHPQHLDGIWIGQNQYRLPLAPLNEFPEPWC